MKMEEGDKPLWWLDKEGRLMYDVVRNGHVIQHGLSPLTPEKTPVTIEQSGDIWRGYKKLAEALIEGDYIGSFKGEINICLNMAHYYWALAKTVEKELGFDKAHELHEKAIALRTQRWSEDLRW